MTLLDAQQAARPVLILCVVPVQLGFTDELYVQVTIANAWEAQQKRVHLVRAAQERSKLKQMLADAGRPLIETCSICLEDLDVEQTGTGNWMWSSHQIQGKRGLSS